MARLRTRAFSMIFRLGAVLQPLGQAEELGLEVLELDLEPFLLKGGLVLVEQGLHPWPGDAGASSFLAGSSARRDQDEGQRRCNTEASTRRVMDRFLTLPGEAPEGLGSLPLYS